GGADARHVELPLAGEVVVEQSLGDPGPRGDLVDRDGVVGVGAEQLEAHAHELYATRVEVVADAGSGGGGAHAVASVTRSLPVFNSLSSLLNRSQRGDRGCRRARHSSETRPPRLRRAMPGPKPPRDTPMLPSSA